MKLSTFTGVIASAGVASAIALPAQAQEESFFERDRYVAVTERPQPAYDPEPLRAGAFEISPELEAGVATKSNLFATTNDEQDDIAFIAAPKLNARSTWSVHEVNFAAGMRHTEYMDVSSETTTEYQAALGGRLDVTSRLKITGDVSADRTFEPRSAVGSVPGAAEPVEIDRAGASLAATYQSGRVRLTGQASFDEFDFADAILTAGGTVEQDFRDREQTNLKARAAVAVNRDVALFVEAGAVTREYDPPMDGQFNRDSDGTILRVGANFELPVLLRGDVAIGHQSFEYDDPLLDDIDGLSIDARVQWFISQLMTFTLTGSQTTEDPGLLNVAGADVQSWTLRSDYEARRNLILFAQANVSNFDFQNSNRTDDALRRALAVPSKSIRIFGWRHRSSTLTKTQMSEIFQTQV